MTLISGASALPDPWRVEAAPGHQRAGDGAAVLGACVEADALIMAAAVADFRPETVAAQKIKKSSPAAALDLHLVQNPDVLQAVHRAYGDLVKVGFVAESRDVLAEAGRKLVAKGLHLICANDVTEEGSGFGTDTNRVKHPGPRQDAGRPPAAGKAEVAERLLDRVETLFSRSGRASPASPGRRAGGARRASASSVTAITSSSLPGCSRPAAMASAVLLPMATPNPAKASISRSFTLSPKATIWDGAIPRRRPRVSRAAPWTFPGPPPRSRPRR